MATTLAGCCCGCTCSACAAQASAQKLITASGVGLPVGCFAMGESFGVPHGKWRDGANANGSYCAICQAEQADLFGTVCIWEATTSDIGILDIYSDSSCTTLIGTVTDWTVRYSIHNQFDRVNQNVLIAPVGSFNQYLIIEAVTTNPPAPFDCIVDYATTAAARALANAATSGGAAVTVVEGCD